MILTTIIVKIFAVIALLFLTLALVILAYGIAQSINDYIEYKRGKKQ